MNCALRRDKPGRLELSAAICPFTSLQFREVPDVSPLATHKKAAGWANRWPTWNVLDHKTPLGMRFARVGSRDPETIKELGR